MYLLSLSVLSWHQLVFFCFQPSLWLSLFTTKSWLSTWLSNAFLWIVLMSLMPMLMVPLSPLTNQLRSQQVFMPQTYPRLHCICQYPQSWSRHLHNHLRARTPFCGFTSCLRQQHFCRCLWPVYITSSVVGAHKPCLSIHHSWTEAHVQQRQRERKKNWGKYVQKIGLYEQEMVWIFRCPSTLA